ncbi:MAG: hypothetical protein K0U47_01630 [Epsilonproteobacteria bacterium]|nr:hypothetical protein [Campylobacterota bacterium]
MKYIINIYTLTFIALFTFTACGGSDTTQQLIENNHTQIPQDNASVYETAENGSIDKWELWSGFEIENVPDGANGSSRSIFVKANWTQDAEGNHKNEAHYELPLAEPNYSQFILEFDKKKKVSETLHCFTVGMTVETENGKRHLSYNPFLDRENIPASRHAFDNGEIEIVLPLSMEYVDEAGVWKHLRLDLREALHHFEPDNDITAVTSFYFQGGDDYLDNIRLVSE